MNSAYDDASRAVVILVFGVPGVGKTFLIKRAVAQFPQCLRVSAADLIATMGEPRRARDDLRKRSESEIVDNQRDVVHGIRETASTYRNKTLLVDAHSVIDNDRMLVPVPVSVIEAIDPRALVFLSDEPAHILKRRREDCQRDRAIRTVPEIDHEQRLALETCRTFAEHMGLGLNEYAVDDEDGFRQFIAEYA